jgi:hypothetical protein
MYPRHGGMLTCVRPPRSRDLCAPAALATRRRRQRLTVPRPRPRTAGTVNAEAACATPLYTDVRGALSPRSGAARRVRSPFLRPAARPADDRCDATVTTTSACGGWEGERSGLELGNSVRGGTEAAGKAAPLATPLLSEQYTPATPDRIPSSRYNSQAERAGAPSAAARGLALLLGEFSQPQPEHDEHQVCTRRGRADADVLPFQTHLRRSHLRRHTSDVHAWTVTSFVHTSSVHTSSVHGSSVHPEYVCCACTHTSSSSVHNSSVHPSSVASWTTSGSM